MMPRGRAPSPSSWLTRWRSTSTCRSTGLSSFMGSSKPPSNDGARSAAPPALASTPCSCSSRARCVNGTWSRLRAKRMRVDSTRSACRRAQLELEGAVALGAAEPAGLTERRVEQSAAGALDAPDSLLVGRGHGIHHAGQEIGDIELVRGRRRLETLLLRAPLAHVD